MAYDQQAADLLKENERLKMQLAKAIEQAERFERGWYLRGDVLEALEAWANAYPVSVFPEPDFGKAREALKSAGISLDAISASNMRYVINGVRELVKNGLAA